MFASPKYYYLTLATIKPLSSNFLLELGYLVKRLCIYLQSKWHHSATEHEWRLS